LHAIQRKSGASNARRKTMSNPSAVPVIRDNMAATYQRVFVPLVPAPLAADLVARVSLRPGERVADIACGTGVVTRAAAERVRPDGTVVGIDPSADMLDVARSLPVPDGSTIDWRLAGAEALPLTDHSCDVVFCQLGLMFVPEPGAAIAEMRRVLAPLGRAAINVPGTMPPIFAIMGDALARHIDPALAGFVRAVFSLHEPALMEQLLYDQHFIDITLEVATYRFRLGPPEDFLWGYLYGTPLGAALADVDPAKLAQMRDEVVSAWQPFTDEHSLVVDQPIVTATARAH
jgi:SAM-dependent methyltransferase